VCPGRSPDGRRRRRSPGADPPRPRRRRLTGCCQHRVSTTRPTNADERAVSLERCPVQRTYNTMTTTGSYQRIRQRCSPFSKRLVMRENTDDHRPAPTGVGALMTRRPRVQMPPPALDEHSGHTAWGFHVAGRASTAPSTGCSPSESLTWRFAAGEPVRGQVRGRALGDEVGPAPISVSSSESTCSSPSALIVGVQAIVER
jgi:hypothetical protein